MLVEIGPADQNTAQNWIRFARRMICELRLHPYDLSGVATDDMLQDWSGLLDQWADSPAPDATFKWSGDLEPDRAEFLLHGLERCLQSESLRLATTMLDREIQHEFSMQIVQAFVNGLSDEGSSRQHYADQVRTSIGTQLDP